MRYMTFGIHIAINGVVAPEMANDDVTVENKM
jgi:hypothetical protein